MVDDAQELLEMQEAAETPPPEAPLETTEVEGEPVAEPDETTQLWGQVAPEVASEIQSLTPEQRERILLKRLAAQSRGDDPDGTPDGNVPPQTVTEPPKPPVVDIPRVDADAIRTELASELGDNAATLLMKYIQPSIQAIDGMSRLVAGALKEQDDRLGKFEGTLRGVTLPNEFRAAMTKVAGASEGDFAAAQKIFDRGDAKTPELALKLAVFERGAEIAASRRPSDEARRIAAAASAARGSTGGTRGGTGRVRIPVTEDGWRTLLEAEARQRPRH